MTPEEIADATKAECLRNAYAAMSRGASHMKAIAWFLAAQHAPDAPATKQEPIGQEALIDAEDDLWYATEGGRWELPQEGISAESREHIDRNYGPTRRVRIIDLDG